MVPLRYKGAVQVVHRSDVQYHAVQQGVGNQCCGSTQVQGRQGRGPGGEEE